jgi:N6-L-threonylcarbamoyladenine synthase
MILGLETSCDETAVALFDPASGLAGEWTHTQVALHARHGGVVPDLATREHLRQLGPLLELARATPGFAKIDRIAVTRGPGLAGCLALGLAGGKALALALRVPLTGVNHLRGHAFSPFLPLHGAGPADYPARLASLLPHLGLLVSGGNTLLFALDEQLRLRVLATTLDDAAGEALDKGAKLLGLGYPGGPLVEQLAATGRPDAYGFPRGLGPRAALDFSFSGLKTSLRYQLEKMSPAEIALRMADLCASYQQAVIDALTRKTAVALENPSTNSGQAPSTGSASSPPAGSGQGSYRSLGLSGGVANNRALRAALAEVARKAGVPLLAAEPRHTGDNAAMIAFAAWADPSCLEPGREGAASSPLADLRIEPSLVLA